MPADVIVLEATPMLPERQRQDPIDLAVRDIEMAGADFMVSILQTHDATVCLHLHRRLEAVIGNLGAVSSSALERADDLLKGVRYVNGDHVVTFEEME